MKIEYCQTHDNLLFFSNKGRVFQIRAWDIPETSRQSKGKAIINLISLANDEKITTFFAYNTENKTVLEKNFFLFTTQSGTVKKTKLSEFKNIRTNGLIAIKLKKNDQLCNVEIVKENDLVFIVASGGKAITFKQEVLRATGRSAIGVHGIKLKPNEIVTSVSIITKDEAKANKILVVTNNPLSFPFGVGVYHAIQVSIDGGTYYQIDTQSNVNGSSKVYQGTCPYFTDTLDIRIRAVYSTTYAQTNSINCVVSATCTLLN